MKKHENHIKVITRIIITASFLIDELKGSIIVDMIIGSFDIKKLYLFALFSIVYLVCRKWINLLDN